MSLCSAEFPSFTAMKCRREVHLFLDSSPSRKRLKTVGLGRGFLIMLSKRSCSTVVVPHMMQKDFEFEFSLSTVCLKTRHADCRATSAGPQF